MNKKKADNNLNISRELHSNLMIVSTLISMIGFALLMIIYMTMRNPSLLSLTTTLPSVGGLVAWISAAILAYKAVKEKKKYFLEYIIYCIIMGFGLTFMFNVPRFISVLLYNNGIVDVARITLIGLVALTGLFFVGSVVWHGVLASPKRK